MADLRARCQMRTDKEHDASISTGEWSMLISEAFGELWGIVCGTGLRYFETSVTIVADGSSSYGEPVDLLSVVSIEYLTDDTTTGVRNLLDPISMQEAADLYQGTTGVARRYALVDDAIHLYPRPLTGSYVLRYVPQATDLVNYLDGDLIDAVTPDGERFLIWCVAVKALAKSESDVQLAIIERDKAAEDLREWAVKRLLFANPSRVVRMGDGYGGYVDPADWWNR